MKGDELYVARGCIVVADTQEGIAGLRVALFDKDHLYDDRLGTTFTDAQGQFGILYREQDFRDLLERAPDLFVQVRDCSGKLIDSTEVAVRWNANRIAEFSIALPRARIEYHQAHLKPLPRLTGGLVAREKLQVIEDALDLLEAEHAPGAPPVTDAGHSVPKRAPLVPRIAAYCPAPGILDFESILGAVNEAIANRPDGVSQLADVIDTLAYRYEVRQPERWAEAKASWRKSEPMDPEAVSAVLEKKRELFGPGAAETLIEKERALPLLIAAVLIAKGDPAVAHRNLGILLGQMRALDTLNVVYRAALKVVHGSPADRGFFVETLRHVGGTCSPNDAPERIPPELDDLLTVDDMWRLERIHCTAELSQAIARGVLKSGSYEIESARFGDGCPGTPFVISGRHFASPWPEACHVQFRNRSGSGIAEAAPRVISMTPGEPPVVAWTDTRIEGVIPDEAGPGPVTLYIPDVGETVCGHWYGNYGRRGNSVPFAGGAAFIQFFGTGTLPGAGAIRVAAGTTLHLHWMVVPSSASARLQILQDRDALPVPEVLDLDGGFDFEIPAGRPSETICTLTAENDCGSDVRVLTFQGYIDPVLAVVGIEVTQATQRFNITGDTSENNSVRLAAGRRTMVRVYVDSGRRDGFDSGYGADMQRVIGQLTMTDGATGEVRTIYPINAGRHLDARPLTDIDRNDLEHSLNFVLTAPIANRVEFRARVESGSPFGERYVAEGSTEVGLHWVGAMRLARILCTDNNFPLFAPTRRGWAEAFQGVVARYPVARFRRINPPGNATTSTSQILFPPASMPQAAAEALADAGWEALLREVSDIADDYEDHGEYWCMTLPNNPMYLYNGISTVGGDLPSLAFRETLQATFAHELGHAHDIEHSGHPEPLCNSCVCQPQEFDDRLPDDAEYHETGVDVFGYRVFPPSPPGNHAGEIMSYCNGPDGFGGQFQNRWPSVEFWDIVFDHHD